jgi:protein-disulfide isomerase
MQKKPSQPVQAQTHPSDWQENIKKQERKEKLKKVGIWVGIIVACVAGMVLLVKLASNSGPSTTTPVENTRLKPITSNDIVMGNTNAQVTITEYSDFQCPACAGYNPLINKILQEYDGKVNVVFRFFPLQSIHENAVLSASAAFAAHKQGKFHEMKDMLFEKQNDWENLKSNDAKITFIAYASSLGLDPKQFEKDMNSKETVAVVLAGEKDAMSLGLNATPTVFVGKKQISSSGYESLKEQVNEALKVQKPLR